MAAEREGGRDVGGEELAQLGNERCFREVEQQGARAASLNMEKTAAKGTDPARRRKRRRNIEIIVGSVTRTLNNRAPWAVFSRRERQPEGELVHCERGRRLGHGQR